MSQRPDNVTITQPVSINIGSITYNLRFDEDITAQVERIPYETLMTYWEARNDPTGIRDITGDSFGAAVLLRLMRGKSIGMLDNKLLLHEHYANS